MKPLFTSLYCDCDSQSIVKGLFSIEIKLPTADVELWSAKAFDYERLKTFADTSTAILSNGSSPVLFCWGNRSNYQDARSVLSVDPISFFSMEFSLRMLKADKKSVQIFLFERIL